MTRTGWLVSHHSFSFGGFQDPARLGYRDLRVLNEDHVIPGAGFAEHGHRDMEIVTLVLSGALEHRDSLGSGSIIRPGEAQLLSAGTGIRHSERNHSEDEALHFLQIWILPSSKGGAARYQQVQIDQRETRERFTVIGSETGGENALRLKQDVRLLLTSCSADEVRSLEVTPDRAGFLQIVSGLVSLEGERLAAGDGLEFLAGEVQQLQALSDCQLLLFDLA